MALKSKQLVMVSVLCCLGDYCMNSACAALQHLHGSIINYLFHLSHKSFTNSV